MGAKKSKKKPKRNPMRQLRTVMMLFLIIGVVYYWKPIYQYALGFIGKQPVEKTTEKSVQGLPQSGVLSTAVIHNKVIVLLKGKLQGFNTAGELLWDVALINNTSFLKDAGDSILVQAGQEGEVQQYGLNGKKMGKIKAPGPFDDIFKTDKGLIYIDKATGQMNWTDMKGNVVGNHQQTDSKILKIKANEVTGEIIVSAIRGQTGTLESILERFDSEGRLIGARTFRDSILLDYYNTENQMVVVLDNIVVCLDSQMKDKWRLSDAALYQSAGFGEDIFWISVVQPENQQSKLLQCYPYQYNSGPPKISLPFTDEITGMAVGPKGQIAVLSNQSLRIFNNKEKPVYETNLGQIPKAVHWLDDKHLLIEIADLLQIIESGGKGT